MTTLIADGYIETTVEGGTTYYTVTDRARERLGVP